MAGVKQLPPIASLDGRSLERNPSDLSMYTSPIRKKAHKRKVKKKKRNKVQTGKVLVLSERSGRSHNASHFSNPTYCISQSPLHVVDCGKDVNVSPKLLSLKAAKDNMRRRGAGKHKSERKRGRAARRIQSAIRGKLGRIRFKRLKRRQLFQIAASSGVLLACEGTVQGESGWYQQTEDSAPVLYEVTEFGEWKLIM